MNDRRLPAYVLITPARNEEAFIEKTIRSVVAQTIRPKRWIIVSDGSTDRTDEIAGRFAVEHAWIELVRRPPHAERHFASKVRSFELGYEKLSGLDYDIIGNLDADLSFDETYMEFLMGKFADDPDLGVAGTPFVDGSDGAYDYRFTNIEHVSGACQLFRKACFESIGRYQPIKSGGIDWVAVTMARMKGWKTRTFTEKCLQHYRKMGTGTGGRLRAQVSMGRQEYYLGNHPLWELFHSVYQMRYRPYIIGGLAVLGGYLAAALRGEERPIPRELVDFIRREQMLRLRRKAGLARRPRPRP
jgi:glycosyltransferase involved in cell wall biosynthesis